MDSGMRDEAEEGEDWCSEEETKGHGEARAVGIGVVADYGGDEGCGGGRG